MFDFPIKQRKLTTYGKKASQTSSYSLARDGPSSEKPKRTTSMDWKIGTSSATKERTQTSPGAGKLVRPSLKKPTDANWDGPSSDDEPVRPLKLPSVKSPKVAMPKLAVSKHSRAKSVPQHDIIVKDSQDVPGKDKKRKREIVARATSEAPRDAVKEVDVFEVPVDKEQVVKRAKSVESGRLTKPRAPALRKKKEMDVFDIPTEDEDSAAVKRPSPVRTRNSSQPPVSKKNEEMDIFDFPMEDEALMVAKKPRPLKPRESSQPLRKRARTPAAEPKQSILASTRGRTKTPELSQLHNTARRVKNWAKAPEPSNHFAVRKPQDHKAVPKPARALPGVGWQPSSVILTPPKRKLKLGLSAPAALFNMIREQPQSPPTDSSDNSTRPATPHLDYDEMDIDTTPSTPPIGDPSSPSTLKGATSQTPRQRQLWGQLLGSHSADSPTDVPISKLNLTSTRKVPALALARSASDIPHTTYSKRSRLIDTLKASAPIVEEDEETEADDTVMEASEETVTSMVVQQTTSGQPDAAIKTASTKVTYAQQRTFLEEKNEDAMYEILAEELSQQTNGLGSQNQHNVIEEEEENEDSQEAAPRGVHDLRAAGSKRRLHDSLDHLVNDVEGMPVQTISARRSALMELAEKLMEPAAVALFLDSGMDLRLIKSFEDVTDTTFTFLAAVSLALLTNAGASLNTLNRIHHSKAFGRILGLLALEQDISKVVKERRSNMSKMAQASVVDFKAIILKSKLFASDNCDKLSPQLMALRCLETVVRSIRAFGSQAAILNSETVGQLLQIAQLRVTQGASDIPTLELVISILEAHTVTPSTERRSTGWSLDLVSMFVSILPSLFNPSDQAIQHCKWLALRLSMNLTNENGPASDIFAQSTVTKLLVESIIQQYATLSVTIGSEGHEANLDQTILALGVMINLAESSDHVRLSIIDRGDDLLSQTVKLFLDGKELAEQADSVEEAEMNVPFGYLAFMLGNLCQNEMVRMKVRARLPERDLGSLVEEMQRFTSMHQSVDMGKFEGAEGEELETGYTQRLQAQVDKLMVLAQDVP